MKELMKRREFITLLGGAAVAWPIAAARSQRSRRPSDFLGFWYRCGTEPMDSPAFVQRLRELG